MHKKENALSNTKKKNQRNQAGHGVLKTVLVILAILAIISSMLLAIRLIDYIKTEEREVALKSDLEKQLEVFSVRYNNASGEVSVEGMDDQNVVAPGVTVEYTIRLRNTDKIAIDYDMIPDIHFTSSYYIPIRVRMISPDGEYIVGDAKTWVDIAELNTLEERGTLKRGESAEYIFQWKWDYESGNDEYDTHLGTTAVTADIGLSVSFTVQAEANTSVVENSVNRDLWNIILLALLVLMLLITFILVVTYIAKKKEEAKRQKYLIFNNDRPTWWMILIRWWRYLR